MNTRILHCSNSLENYYLCLEHRVAGFTNRGPQSGDQIYLVVKVGKKSLCGARFTLDEPTDNKPWADADNYVHTLSISGIEYCHPFDISFLSAYGGQYWGMKYLQGSKAIKDQAAVEALYAEFRKNKTATLVHFDLDEEQPAPEEPVEETIIEDEKELLQVEKEVPNARISIMGTFQTIQFTNETDKIQGLEVLVNSNFYSLFPQFPLHRSLLIPENRLFQTKGKDDVQGIRSKPDALLIVFDKSQKNKLQVNLIEYECYGEKKYRETEKSGYMNTTIIPQLMRFVSAFSVITDDKTREGTIKDWVNRIIDYINADDALSAKVSGWVKELDPQVRDRSIDREIEKMLTEAFTNHLRVMLIIDELSPDQKSTIKNVIRSFKLKNNTPIEFSGYVVRLVQKINVMNQESEFALTVQ